MLQVSDVPCQLEFLGHAVVGVSCCGSRDAAHPASRLDWRSNNDPADASDELLAPDSQQIIKLARFTSGDIGQPPPHDALRLKSRSFPPQTRSRLGSLIRS